MNNFIISGNGFLKSICFDKQINENLFEWTQQIRYAKRYKTFKHAKNTITKFKLDAFVWNPYKEEPIIGKWEIKQRQNFKSFIDDDIHNVLEWRPKRVVMENKTDVEYLVTNGINNKTYYDTYEEAVEACQIKNLEMLNELQTKMLEMNKTINQK